MLTILLSIRFTLEFSKRFDYTIAELILFKQTSVYVYGRIMKERIVSLLRRYKHVWVFSYFLIYIPWFLHLERTVFSYHIMYHYLDDYIPFNEYFIVPYYWWFLYMMMTIAFFFLKDVEEFYRYVFYLVIGMTFCLLVCQIYPNGTDFRPTVDPNKNWAMYLVSLIHKADTPTNVFPSIHVYNSIGTYIAIAKSKHLKNNRLIQILSFISMVTICASTVFLKQHSILDVFGAIIVGYIVYLILYHDVLVGESEKEKVTV